MMANIRKSQAKCSLAWFVSFVAELALSCDDEAKQVFRRALKLAGCACNMLRWANMMARWALHLILMMMSVDSRYSF